MVAILDFILDDFILDDFNYYQTFPWPQKPIWWHQNHVPICHINKDTPYCFIGKHMHDMAEMVVAILPIILIAIFDFVLYNFSHHQVIPGPTKHIFRNQKWVPSCLIRKDISSEKTSWRPSWRPSWISS